MFIGADAARDPAVAKLTADLAGILAQYGPRRSDVGIGAIAAGFDYAAALLQGKPLHSLDEAGRAAVLAALQKIPGGRDALWVSSLLYKMTYLFNEETMRRVGTRYGGIEPPKTGEHQRWLSQLERAADSSEDVELEAEVIVIGTGAGGAAAAYELARRGVAVAMIEAGDHFTRQHFTGEWVEATTKIYRFTPALGNGFITILSGSSVGGTTTINSGTCYRTPDDILAKWRKRGLGWISPEELAPYFAGVEEMLGVAEGESRYVGPLYDIVKRGADAIGLGDVHRLHRNAPGCDGQALCPYGCPTAAKRSTDVSYVPAALEKGAYLYAGFKVDRLLRDGDRIAGVTAHGRRQDGSPVHLKIKAPNVILAMGTLHTPVFLMEQGIANKHLGRHLTVHPTGMVGGVFPGADLQNDKTIIQGVGSGGMIADHIRFEGATPPFAVYGLTLRSYGREWKEIVDAYASTAFFGFMISDTSEGRVWRNVKGLPVVTYWQNREDLRRYVKAMATNARIFFKAGAEKVVLHTAHADPVLRSEKDVDRFENRRWSSMDFTQSAYHPLGTARLGASAESGVVDEDHRVYGVEGLYVMDGSVVPTSPAVNPQITIMALASRAAVRLADRLNAKISTPTPVTV
jgi:choline dehydrogenase-like flavoprotein